MNMTRERLPSSPRMVLITRPMMIWSVTDPSGRIDWARAAIGRANSAAATAMRKLRDEVIRVEEVVRIRVRAALCGALKPLEENREDKIGAVDDDEADGRVGEDLLSLLDPVHVAAGGHPHETAIDEHE